MEEVDFTISVLGESAVQSPVFLSKRHGDFAANYVTDREYILYDIETCADKPFETPGENHLLEKAGPREKIYFEPKKVHAAIVTCGGLCPGLNDVIRSIVMCLWYHYGVQKISGIRFGYRGLIRQFNLPVLELRPQVVDEIHRDGGTILGSSRGHGDCVGEIVDTLQEANINMLFTIGGDGTHRGSLGIAEEIKKRGLKIAVVGVPKTIDNDLSFVQRSFGFETAVAKAAEVVAAAHVEAHDAINGVGVVKVMGRDSGFIAAHTAIAINDVNFVLIPEIPFDLEGPNGLFSNLEKRLLQRGHAVILTAEGAGQELLERGGRADASGNIKLADIGVFLKDEINAFFKESGMEINLKYIDPSYIIRGTPANANDSIYCARLGANAVHAAMAGKTELVISLFNERFVHVPIRMTTSRKNNINPESSLWRDVVEATGQTPLMKNQQ